MHLITLDGALEYKLFSFSWLFKAAVIFSITFCGYEYDTDSTAGLAATSHLASGHSGDPAYCAPDVCCLRWSQSHPL